MTNISRKLRHLVIFPLCALFFFIGAVTAQAATYYVATTGDDAHLCATAQTITTPKRTLASAIACLSAGDTLYLRGGTWTEPIDVLTKTGAAGAPITFKAYPGERIILAQQPNKYAIVPRALVWLIFDGLIIDGTSTTAGCHFTIDYGSHDVIVRNMEFKNIQGNGVIIGANNITIQNNKIHDQVSASGVAPERWYGIYFHHGNNGLIEGNDIYNNPGGGIQAYPGPTNLIIRNNRIHNNNKLASSHVGGIVVQQGSGYTVTGVQVYNNLVYNNGTPTSGNGYGIQVNGVTGTKIWNNTFYNNKSYGIGLNSSGSSDAAVNTVVQNNITSLNGLGDIFDGGTGSIIDHNLDTDQSFVNAAAFNFNLQTNSPAIDAGVTLSQVRTDIKNTPRPQGGAYDIGAYEAATGSDNAAPATPHGLNIK